MTSYDTFAQEWLEGLKKNLGHIYIEKPAMYELLPDLTGKSVLCIGSGSGEECHYLQTHGASRVVGIDNSTELIKLSRQQFPELEFQEMDMLELDFPDNQFDLVYSSLVFHYAEDWDLLLSQVCKALKPGGTLLFSTQHPIFWGAEMTRTPEKKSVILGYEHKREATEVTFYGHYLTEFKKDFNLFEKWPITYFNRPISLMFSSLHNAGFSVLNLVEPKPLPAVKEIDPKFFAVFSEIPIFVIFKCESGN